jgi:transcriptional regulator EpsA
MDMHLTDDHSRLMKTVWQSLHIKRHFQFFQWLQGDFQHFVPHEIFIAAWGNFSEGLVQFDVVSSLPAIRTSRVDERDLTPFVVGLFNQWIALDAKPFDCNFEDGVTIGPTDSTAPELEAIRKMKSALVHGIRDERRRHDCLYIFLHTNPEATHRSFETFRIALPFIDTALRQVEHLPSQRMTALVAEPSAATVEATAAAGNGDSTETDSRITVPNDSLQFLSAREQEIMEWVQRGKTNYEIGIILDISTFTVKNHLQRIFRKLDVTNRAQAVGKARSPEPQRKVAGQ